MEEECAHELGDLCTLGTIKVEFDAGTWKDPKRAAKGISLRSKHEISESALKGDAKSMQVGSVIDPFGHTAIINTLRMLHQIGYFHF